MLKIKKEFFSIFQNHNVGAEIQLKIMDKIHYFVTKEFDKSIKIIFLKENHFQFVKSSEYLHKMKFSFTLT